MDTFFFWCSKLIWAIVSPDHLLIFAVTLACVLFWLGRYKLARGLLTVCVLIFWLIASMPIGQWLLAPLESTFPVNPPLPDHIDGIIMLGGNEKIEASIKWQQVELKAYTERALAFMRLVRQYPDAKRVFAGGSGGLKALKKSEADIAAQLFQQQGLDVSSIQFESNSRNTYENAVLTKELLKPKVGEFWLLITSASHMPRAVGVFCQADWPVAAYPVDHWSTPSQQVKLDFAFAEHLEQFIYGTREWLGLAGYYFSGKIRVLVPKTCIKS
jgi:uncharacterized SAM-binding protein YcdF (DUF218 family)